MKIPTVIAEPQYLGCISHFALLAQSSKTVLDLNLPFRKMTFINRCIIAGSRSTVSLSIPLSGGRGIKAPITSIQICNDESWQKKHWKAIQSCYAKSPFFEYYAHHFSTFYQQEQASLALFLQNLYVLLFSLIGLENLVRFDTSDTETSTAVDFKFHHRPSNFQEAPHCFPPYFQTFQGNYPFLPNLSILDLLFCMGKESHAYLKKVLVF